MIFVGMSGNFGGLTNKSTLKLAEIFLSDIINRQPIIIKN